MVKTCRTRLYCNDCLVECDVEPEPGYKTEEYWYEANKTAPFPVLVQGEAYCPFCGSDNVEVQVRGD